MEEKKTRRKCSNMCPLAITLRPPFYTNFVYSLFSLFLLYINNEIICQNKN